MTATTLMMIAIDHDRAQVDYYGSEDYYNVEDGNKN